MKFVTNIRDLCGLMLLSLSLLIPFSAILPWSAFCLLGRIERLRDLSACSLLGGGAFWKFEKQ